MNRRTAVASLVASLLSGCGDWITVNDYFNGLQTVSTNLVICRLGFAPEYASAFTAAGSSTRIADSIADANKGIASGRVKYDGSEARRCIDRLNPNPSSCLGPNAPASSSRPLSRLPAECAAVFTGAVVGQGTCYENVDCVSAFCNASVNCPGKCENTLQKGADCSNVRPCASGLRCIAGKCEPPGATGADCGDDLDCQDPLICASLKCVARPQQNGACSLDNDQCADGFFCQETAGVPTCQPRVDAGAACTASAAGYSPSIISPQCKGSQTCAGRTPGTPGKCGVPQDVGGPCTPPAIRAAGPTGCFFGLVCDPATSKCALPPKAGSHCIDYICDLNTAYCDYAGGSLVCAAKINDGGACANDWQCHPSSICDGHCSPPTSSGPVCPEG